MFMAKVGTLLHLNLVTSSDIEVVKPRNLPSKYITVTLNFDTSIHLTDIYVIFMLSANSIKIYTMTIDNRKLHLALTFIL